MKPGAHRFEDKLLEFAYGELPDHEARALEAHLSGCPRCSDALGSIRGVRKNMARLPVEAAPDAGLESLLAYAEQAARRMSAGPAPRPVWWRRLVAPLAGVAALAVIGIVALETSKSTDLTPAKADYDVAGAKTGRSAPSPKPAEMAQVAPAQNAAEPVAAAAAPADPNVWGPPPAAATPPPAPSADAPKYEPRLAEGKVARKAGTKADLEADYSGATGGAKALASKGKAEEAPVFDELQKNNAEAKEKLATKDQAANKKTQAVVRQEQAEAKPPPEKPGVAALGNIGERAGDVDEDGVAFDKQFGGGGRGTGSTAQMAQALRPSPSMGLSFGSDRSAPGSSMPAPTSRAVEPSRERIATTAASTGSEAESRRDSKFDQADRDRQQAGELKGLLDRARRVSSSGDHSEEIRLAHEVLNRGAKGYQRLEALKRLCDAYSDTGREGEATPFCQAVLREFPDSGAAKLVQKRFSQPRPSEMARQKAKKSPSNEPMFDDAAKPAASPAKAAEPAAAPAAY